MAPGNHRGPSYSDMEIGLLVALRRRNNLSWQQIAQYLGTSRSHGSCQVRYSRLSEDDKNASRLPVGWVYTV